LTGEGADEVFGGYDLFKEGKIRKFWSRHRSSEIRPILLKKLYPYLDISSSNSLKYLQEFFGVGLDKPHLPYFSHMPRWKTTAKIKSFYSSDVQSLLNRDAVDVLQNSLPSSINNWDSFSQAQYIEAKMLMAKYLLSSQGDRMLMANSVEGRFPFLDHDIIEFANKLSPKLKMKVLNEKYILKKSVSRYLPESILTRNKQPYRSPDIPSFINKNTQQYIEELLSPQCIKEYGYFDPKKVSLFMKKVNKGRVLGYGDNMSFMAILSTQMLHKQFIDDYQSSSSFYLSKTEEQWRNLKSVVNQVGN
jgi:asparagine synthase (glutamine-hydrolysing)